MKNVKSTVVKHKSTVVCVEYLYNQIKPVKLQLATHRLFDSTKEKVDQRLFET